MHLRLIISKITSLDSKAKGVYSHMAKVLLSTGNIAEETVRKVKVADGIKPDELIESLNSIATEMGIKPVGDLPLKQLAANFKENDIVKSLMLYFFIKDKSFIFYSFYLIALIWHQFTYVGMLNLFAPYSFVLFDSKVTI